MSKQLESTQDSDTIRENNEREDNIDQEEKALLDQFPGGKGIKDVIELIKKDRMDAMAEAKRALREDGALRFLLAFTRPITLSPLDSKEAVAAVEALRTASLAMLSDIQRSDAMQPRQLVKELFGIMIFQSAHISEY